MDELVVTEPMDMNTDNTDNEDTEDSNMLMEIKSVVDHAISKLSEGCIYSKDMVAMINAPTAKTLKVFYKELDKATQHKGYKNYSTNHKLGKYTTPLNSVTT